MAQISFPSALESQYSNWNGFCRKKFKAAPLNKKIFDGPSGLKHAERLPITEPVDPKFVTSERAARYAARQPAENEVRKLPRRHVQRA